MFYLFRSIIHQSIDIGRTQNAIIVAGSARSGTTWVGDMIADATHSRIIFEPFLVDFDFELSLAKNREREHSNIVYERSLSLRSEDCISNNLHKQINKIISGRLYTHWTEQQRKKGIFTRRLIKDIRVSLMMGYIARHWPLVPIVYVIRNPFDVILSQVKKNNDGWNFGWNNSELGILELDKDNRFLNLHDKLKKGDTLVTSSINRWVVENIAAVNDLEKVEQAMIVNYDKLKKSGNYWDEVVKFFDALGVPFDLSCTEFKRPSFTSNTNVNNSLINTSDVIKESDALYLKQLIQESILAKYITI